LYILLIKGSNFLFTASLVLMCNEFFQPLPKQCLSATVDKAIAVMNYSAVIEPQAQRLLSILEKFKRVIAERSVESPAPSNPNFLENLGPDFDPMADLARSVRNASLDYNQKRRRVGDLRKPSAPSTGIPNGVVPRPAPVPTPRPSISEPSPVLLNPIGLALSSAAAVEATLTPVQYASDASLIPSNRVTDTSISPGSNHSEGDKFESQAQYEQMLHHWHVPGASHTDQPAHT
jgi:hypothetical protein